MRLYWVDAFFDKIEHSTFDGRNRLSLERITQISHPFGLTIFGGDSIFSFFKFTKNGMQHCSIRCIKVTLLLYKIFHR